jgi:U4/U6 small nuclear ribonucleoprotein PRP4
MYMYGCVLCWRGELGQYTVYLCPVRLCRIGTESEEEEDIQYPFFTEGTHELLKARVDIAHYSLPRAKARIERAKRHHEDPDEDQEAEAELVVKQAGEFVLECSEIGDDRPLKGN